MDGVKTISLVRDVSLKSPVTQLTRTPGQPTKKDNGLVWAGLHPQKAERTDARRKAQLAIDGILPSTVVEQDVVLRSRIFHV